ncbi:77f6bff8-7c28-445a-9f81-799c6e3eb661 [Thermothielavioides terrestris]|uniref:77f6bff8-7c28-445a-9f81-799c6e3eb661 n=1 Tax=Thermothielavioides terrestris TaxID=2587410 RepID=A0A446BXC7_9PEZI|nr:77f6bff8-7c28-445a-9f81-799c6e3eb661 [Thermothielavioides terrestris]
MRLSDFLSAFACLAGFAAAQTTGAAGSPSIVTIITITGPTPTPTSAPTTSSTPTLPSPSPSPSAITTGGAHAVGVQAPLVALAVVGGLGMVLL